MNAEHINIGPVLGTDVDIVFKILGRTQENGTIAKNYEIVNINNFYVEVKTKEKNQLFLFYIIYVFPSYVSFSWVFLF